MPPIKGGTLFERRLKSILQRLPQPVLSLIRVLTLPPVRVYFRYLPAHPGKGHVWRVTADNLWWLGSDVKTRTIFGDQMMVNTSERLGRSIYYFGIWEPNLTYYVLDHLQEGDVFIDVGANVGYYSILAGKAVGETGGVVAIEAAPQTFEQLCVNLKLNAIQNCRLLKLAAWNGPGEISFFAKADRSDVTSTANPELAQKWGNQREFKVPCAPLSSALTAGEAAKARLIKIDVEGAEWRVLEGMSDMISQCRPDMEVVVELAQEGLDAAGKKCDDVVDLFRRWGFRPYLLDNDYRPETYIQQRRSRPRRVERLTLDESHLADVVFSRRQVDTL